MPGADAGGGRAERDAPRDDRVDAAGREGEASGELGIGLARRGRAGREGAVLGRAEGALAQPEADVPVGLVREPLSAAEDARREEVAAGVVARRGGEVDVALSRRVDHDQIGVEAVAGDDGVVEVEEGRPGERAGAREAEDGREVAGVGGRVEEELEVPAGLVVDAVELGRAEDVPEGHRDVEEALLSVAGEGQIEGHGDVGVRRAGRLERHRGRVHEGVGRERPAVVVERGELELDRVDAGRRVTGAHDAERAGSIAVGGGAHGAGPDHVARAVGAVGDGDGVVRVADPREPEGRDRDRDRGPPGIVGEVARARRERQGRRDQREVEPESHGDSCCCDAALLWR